MFAYTLTPKSLNLFMDGKVRTIDQSHINYGAILEVLKQSVRAKSQVPAIRDSFLKGLRDLIDIPSFVAKVTEGRVRINDDAVIFDGQPVSGVIQDRLIQLLTEGFDPRPLARFLDKLMDNPTETARDELYLFLEASGMPITDDGDFLAYKYVRDDYKSQHDRKTDNSIGATVEMPREACDPYRGNTCSTGLHFSSYDYANTCRGHGSRMVVVKINPRDVVAIPNDYSNAKGRACRYVVVDEVNEQATFPAVVSKVGTYTGAQDDDGYSNETEEEHHECACGDAPPVEVKQTKKSKPVKAKSAATDKPRIEEKPGKAPVFIGKRPDHEWTPSDLKKEVDTKGQRAFAREYDIPRTTVQGWLRKAIVALSKKKR